MSVIGDNLSKDLENNLLLREDLKTIISYSISYIPMIGLVCSGIIIAKHIIIGKNEKTDVV